MMPQQPTSQGPAPKEQDLINVPDQNRTAEALANVPGDDFGSHLRALRETRGLGIEACAHALKLPARVLRQLESGQHDGIDHQVYLGSYITKYGRFLGLDEELVQAEVVRIRRREEPVLVTTGGISHSRYLLERYATAATYLVLTAVIIVPMIWLGVRGTLDRDIGRLAPLDAAPVAQQELPATSDAGDAKTSPVPRVAAAKTAVDDQPLLASMVPDLSMESLKPASATAVTSVAQGGHTLGLALTDSSWVEITAADGTRLEYGLLPAGTDKTYHSDKPLEIRLGNVTGAQVRLDGRRMALDAYRRANVAHFRIEIEGDEAVPHGA